jgi:hypothetical protein
MGTWVDNTRFVFSKDVYANVTMRVNMVVSTNDLIHNLVAYIIVSTAAKPGGYFTGAVVDRNYHPTEGSGLGVCSGSASYSGRFKTGDFVEVKYLACTTYGTATTAYYGGIRNIASTIEILAFPGV